MAPEMAGSIDAHLDRLIEATRPWSSGRDYLNLADRPGDASGAFSAEVYARLRDVKAQRDPGDLFQSNHPVS